jgi:nucleotide-binding universal stress UspA family protein
MFAKVVAGVDASSPSEGLLACLGGLRAVGTREVLLVHALGIRPLDEERRTVAPAVERRLAALRGAIEQLGLRASTEIAPGVPAPELARVARERAAALIVLGEESSRARDLLLGSVTVQVLHRTDLPVLVPGARPGGPAKGAAEATRADLRTHVLFATDFSDTAERALQYLEQLVRDGARRVTLVRVQNPPPRRRRIENLARRLLFLGADDVRAETPAGVPQDQIVRLAAEVGATLVVIGTSGRGSASTVYLGSVSHGVGRGAPCPVLLVPPDRSAADEP